MKNIFMKNTDEPSESYINAAIRMLEKNARVGKNLMPCLAFELQFILKYHYRSVMLSYCDPFASGYYSVLSADAAEHYDALSRIILHLGQNPAVPPKTSVPQMILWCDTSECSYYSIKKLLDCDIREVLAAADTYRTLAKAQAPEYAPLTAVLDMFADDMSAHKKLLSELVLREDF